MTAAVWIALVAAVFSIVTAAFSGWNRFTQMEILLEISKVRLEIAQIRVDAAEWRVVDRHGLRNEMHEAILKHSAELDERLESIEKSVDRRFADVGTDLQRLVDRVHSHFDKNRD